MYVAFITLIREIFSCPNNFVNIASINVGTNKQMLYQCVNINNWQKLRFVKSCSSSIKSIKYLTYTSNNNFLDGFEF